MRKGLVGIALSGICGFFAATGAHAGVIVTSTHTDLDNKQTGQTTIYIEADRMKVVSPDTTMIFRGDQNKVWLIRGKTYSEMTQEMLRNMGGQMAGASAQMSAAQMQMQAKLAQLPPEQRALVEARMGALGGPPGGAPGGGGAQVTYTASGPGKTVANWRCAMFQKNINGQKEEDVCIAPIASAGLTQADFQVMDSFSAFMAPILTSPMAPHNDYMSWKDMNKATGFQGFPVETTVYVRGKPSFEDSVQKIEHAPIPSAAFDLPAGLTKQTGRPG